MAVQQFPEGAEYVFLVITWGEGGEDQRETFGPYPVRPGWPHLAEIAEKAESWVAEHPDRPDMKFYLFATAAVPPGGSPDLETVP